MDELELGRRRSRRRMAQVAFWFMIAAAIAIVVSSIMSPARTEIAGALATAGVVLGSIFGTLTIIILGYLGFSSVEQWKK